MSWFPTPWYRAAALGTTLAMPAPVVLAGESLVSGALALDGGFIHDERPRDGGGSLDGDWQLAEARLFLRPHRAVRVGLGLGASRDAYHTSGLDHDLPTAVRHAWVRVPLAVMFHERWGVTVQGSFGTGYADGATAGQGRQWQVQGGPLYRRDDDLIVAVLLNVSSRIGDSPSVFAFPSLYWRFHSDWRLTVVDDVDNLSSLRWAVRDDLDLGLRVDVRLREAAVSGDQAFADDHVAAGLQASWMPDGRGGAEITPFVGVQLVRRVALRDADGDEAWSFVTRPAPLVGLSLRASF